MSYTVKQLSDLAGVSKRTLHYYDQIGVLKPAYYGQNGYRYYGEESVLRLQQILFFRELDFSLKDIKAIIDGPAFDTLQALQGHKIALQARVARLNGLIETIERTILHLEGRIEMDKKDFYEGFSEEKQKEYARKARERYGNQVVEESERRWQSYSPERKEAIQAEAHAILSSLCDQMASGHDSAVVQQLVRAWHQHLGNFYECSYERLLGLGQLYTQDSEFSTMFETKYHPDLPAFFYKAIEHYANENAEGGKTQP